ncbi:spermatogenesis-associated protein 2-like protein [Phaethornis superciliosus]
MCAGSAQRQEHRDRHRERYREQHREQYRRSLDREHSSDPSSFEQRLRQGLRQDSALLGALQPEAPALLARGLRGRPELGPALRGLAGAFRLLELAATNLHLCPWRREFGTIQTYSGAYVHLLRPALPEADLVWSFGQLGYRRHDRHRLVLSRTPPESVLVAAACGFLACRLECEILEEVVERLRPRRLHPEELLEARQGARDLEGCVEVLRRGTWHQDHRRETRCQEGDDSVDLYRETATGPDEMEGEDAAPPVPQRDPGSPQGWHHYEHGQQPLLPTGSPTPDPFPEPEPGTGQRPPVPGEPQDLPLELPRYQLHSCLGRGSLPSYCCGTCQQLHTHSCAAGQQCRSQHRGQELRGERQRRLWLQRTEVDMLLANRPQS